MNAGSIPNYRATVESKAPKDLGFIQKRVDKPMMEYEVEGCQTTLRHMEMQIYHAYISISQGNYMWTSTGTTSAHILNTFELARL